jgi:hypothetical protein
LKSAEVAGASARTIAAHIARHAHAPVRRIADEGIRLAAMLREAYPRSVSLF